MPCAGHTVHTRLPRQPVGRLLGGEASTGQEVFEENVAINPSIHGGGVSASLRD